MVAYVFVVGSQIVVMSVVGVGSVDTKVDDVGSGKRTPRSLPRIWRIPFLGEVNSSLDSFLRLALDPFCLL